MTRILDPRIGSVVTYNSKGAYYDVYIASVISLPNEQDKKYYYWRRVLPDGSLGHVEHGYGNFFETSQDYKVVISVKKKERNKTPDSRYKELLKHVLAEIDSIDKETLWQGVEPMWWLNMMELRKCVQDKFDEYKSN